MKHELHTPSDFTNEDMDKRCPTALAVCDGGLYVCKECGAAEQDLVDHPTCEQYKEAKSAYN